MLTSKRQVICGRDASCAALLRFGALKAPDHVIKFMWLDAELRRCGSNGSLRFSVGEDVFGCDP